MSTQAPSVGRILTMVAFAISCVGLLIFLWISFGGSLPLAPEGYRLSAEFDEAVQLADQADVRISGVSVGKVVGKSLDRRTGLTRAVIQFDHQFAPRPADTRAILRQKSLLGETYIELTPGSNSAPKLPDGAMLPRAQVAPTVQLDQILSTFDPATRHAFQIWQQQDTTALTNRGADLNVAIAELYPFASNVDAALAVLRREGTATSTLLREGGIVFSSLARSPSQLQGLIRNSNAVFAATAAQDTALADTVKAFPGFLKATRSTIDRIRRFSVTAKPLIDELHPAARQLSPALVSVAALAPELRNVLVDIGPLTDASRAGVPALEQFLSSSVPWLGRLKPYLGHIVPILDYVNKFRRELAAFFANSTATTEATLLNISQTKQLHYLRLSNPVNPETLTAYQNRLSSNRGNPYVVPGASDGFLSGLPVFGSYLCTNNPQPTTFPSSITASLLTILNNVYYTKTPGGPPCKAQPLLGAATTGQPQAFPHLQPLP